MTRQNVRKLNITLGPFIVSVLHLDELMNNSRFGRHCSRRFEWEWVGVEAVAGVVLRCTARE